GRLIDRQRTAGNSGAEETATLWGGAEQVAVLSGRQAYSGGPQLSSNDAVLTCIHATPSARDVHFLATSPTSVSGVHLSLEMATAGPTRIERRCGLRFTQFQVPVLLQAADGTTGAGFTLDLSSRGALLWTDFPMQVGQVLDMSLVMPSEITLGEDMS